jgi:hypothetical protein
LAKIYEIIDTGVARYATLGEIAGKARIAICIKEWR